MPDIVLDYHRLRTPIDHPDASVTRAKLEYPTADVSFAYLASINKTVYGSHLNAGYVVLTKDIFTDKAAWASLQVNSLPHIYGRYQSPDTHYITEYNPPATAADQTLHVMVLGSTTNLATAPIDIALAGRGLAISCSGSAIKSLGYSFRVPARPVTDPLNLPAPDIPLSATNTDIADGRFGFRFLRDHHPHGGTESGSVWLKAPLTPLPQAQAVVELDFDGNGSIEEPFRPSLTRSLVEIKDLSGLPDFLYLEAKKYETLINKGFAEDEIKLIFGYIPQHQVDLDSVMWGTFEFHPDKSNNAIVIVTGDNPYRQGAIERQKARAKRIFKQPRDYNEAIDLYKSLVEDHPHWLAGKDNFAYQTLGLEIFDLLQNVDFYYGELIEHKTHYNQLKQTPDWEIEKRIKELIDKLSTETVLTDQRSKHINKAKEILKRGW